MSCGDALHTCGLPCVAGNIWLRNGVVYKITRSTVDYATLPNALTF